MSDLHPTDFHMTRREFICVVLCCFGIGVLLTVAAFLTAAA